MIKRIEQEKEYQVKPYPKLMIGKGSRQVVLFSGKGCGVVVDKGIDGSKHGSHSTSWSMGCFTDYNEPVTIVNV